MTVNPDIYHNDKKYAAALLRLKNDPGILKANKATIKKFLDSREANGLSLSRIVKHANHLIVAGRLCNKRFQKMTKDDVIQLLLDLKHMKKTKGWLFKGNYQSENILNDYKIILKLFWRWMKGMNEDELIYPELCEKADTPLSGLEPEIGTAAFGPQNIPVGCYDALVATSFAI